MSINEYEESRKKIEDILNSKTKIEEVESLSNDEDKFTYENGVRTWVGAMFIDIRDSTDYFKNNNQEIVARIMRSFTSEIIRILSKNKSYIQIGIRGDCVYAIYSTPEKNILKSIMSDACYINTFQKMFQKILEKKQWPTFKIGIGMGASKDLVIKAGMKGTGIRDNIWIGDAVIDASKLSSEGNTGNIGPITMDSCFYINIKDYKCNQREKYGDLIEPYTSNKLNTTTYHCDMIDINFNNWIGDNFNE